MGSLFVVTPCGDTIEDVYATVQSVIDVAQQNSTVCFRHHLVFNNGLEPDMALATAHKNYHCTVSDLGDVGSRAQARNHALDALTANSPGVVCFIDAGDLLLNEGAVEHALATIDHSPAQSLWAYAGRIVGENLNSARPPRPLWTRKIGNPFFIGATFISTDLASTYRFSEGAKEDWKYWLEILDDKPHVELRDEIAYAYQVVSVADHLRRKRRLLGDQYYFFAEYLGYGHGVRTSLSMLAHVALAGGSWIRRLGPRGRGS